MAGSGRPRGETTACWSLRAASHPEGGKGSPLGDQEAVGGDAQRGVVVKTSPASPFIVAEADLLLQVLIITLDTPPQLRGIDEIRKADAFG